MIFKLNENNDVIEVIRHQIKKSFGWLVGALALALSSYKTFLRVKQNNPK
jgi:hypothetical protein